MNYEFFCKEHGMFEISRLMSDSANPAPCPQCGKVGMRVFSSPAIRVVRKERLQFGYGSPGRILTKKETGGLDVFIPSMGAMGQDEVDYIAEAAVQKEKERVKRNKGKPRSESQARIQSYTDLALKTPKGKRAKVLREAIKDTGDKARNNKGVLT